MSVQLLTLSHSPLLGINDPKPEVAQELEKAFATAREAVTEYDPDLVILFTPDHYNGVFYTLMPPYCIGYQARGIGDYGSQEGPLNVPEDTAGELAGHLLENGIDIAVSRRMDVDHGATQPLELMFGDIAAKPTIPVFVNGVARPFAPMERVRRMGQAVGEFIKNRDERILLVASGGLSHDPPLPQWSTATEEQRHMLLHGHQDPESRAAREARVIAAGKQNIGAVDLIDINPTWDRQFMADCASGRPEVFDAYTADEMDADAGHSSHEVRTWVAAFSALAQANGSVNIDYSYYEAIPEFVAGFGLMTAH